MDGQATAQTTHTAPPKSYRDGWTALAAGADAGRDPSLIDKDQCALAINATFRGGFARTRPYFAARPITFTSPEEKDWFENELYQGMYFYSIIATPNAVASATNQGFIVYMVGGRLWTISPRTFNAIEITPPDGRNSRLRNMAYFTQAEQWLIVQDGQSAAILWDGGNSRRAGIDEVPVGTNMAYGQGRTWVIVGNQVFAGDIVGGPGGPNAVINFTERKILQQSGDVSPSFVIGNPNFLEFIPQQDTATGVGTLLVGGEHGVTSIFAEKPRTSWADGISRVVLFGIGGTGHRSPAQINGDVWWRASNGMRSYRQARAEVYTLAQLPLSSEMDPIFQADTPALLPWVSSAEFDNRLLTTVSPRVCNGRVYFAGLAVCDFHILSSGGKEIVKPAWDFIWSGVNFYEVHTGGGRCWAAAIDELGRNCLYEILADKQQEVADQNPDGSLRRVRAKIVSGAYVGQNAGGDTPKRLDGGKFTVRQVKEEVDITVQFRKDGEQCWRDWDRFHLCANTTLCSIAPDLSADLCPQLVANPQYRAPIVLQQPENTEAQDNNAPIGAGAYGLPMINGYEFQAAFSWEGNVQLRSFTMDFGDGWERLTSGCYPPEECTTARVCCEDLFEFTPELPVYLIPPTPFDPTNKTLTAEQLIINFLGNGLLHPIDDVLAALPFPPEVSIPALNNLINTGVVSHPSGPPGGGGIGLFPIREL